MTHNYINKINIHVEYGRGNITKKNDIKYNAEFFLDHIS